MLVDDDTGNSALQRLRFWVDTDNDGLFSDETTLLDTTAVDDDWSGGYVGVFRGGTVTAVTQFDDFKAGIDNSSPKDGDFDDGGDEIAIDDNFNSAAISLSYDNNGNLTDDGIFKFVYDAWNRLVKAKHRSASNAAVIGTYVYDGAMRRQKKIVTNQGPELIVNDGGNTSIAFQYDQHWRIVEDRNGSNQTVHQYLGGAQYVDECVWIEVNGDPSIGNDTSPDITATGEASEPILDCRSFLHTDQLWTLRSISSYDATGTNNGTVVEYHCSDGLNKQCILRNESQLMSATSAIGCTVSFQGLHRDAETSFLANRLRVLAPGRFLQRDPLGYASSMHMYLHLQGNPYRNVDPSGALEVRVMPAIRTSLCDYLSPTAPMSVNAVMLCNGCGWRDEFDLCQASSTQSEFCDNCGGRWWTASVRATAKPIGTIIVRYAEVTVPANGCPNANPPFNRAPLSWLQSFAQAIANCTNQHEDARIRIDQSTFVEMTATGTGHGCSRAEACANARTSASNALAVQKRQALLIREILQRELDSSQDTVNCVRSWLQANPPP